MSGAAAAARVELTLAIPAAGLVATAPATGVAATPPVTGFVPGIAGFRSVTAGLAPGATVGFVAVSDPGLAPGIAAGLVVEETPGFDVAVDTDFEGAMDGVFGPGRAPVDVPEADVRPVGRDPVRIAPWGKSSSTMPGWSRARRGRARRLAASTVMGASSRFGAVTGT